MEPNLTLDDAVRRWQTLREQGKSVEVDDLCSDSPEVATDFAERLRVVASMAAFLGIEPEPPPDITRGGEDPPLDSPAPSTEHSLDLPGYEILGELGRGGMGVVYLARQLNLDRVVALKRILTPHHATPEQVTRFRNEARAVAKLRHPHIVQVHEVGDHDGLPYITFEYIRGGSLDRRLTGTPLSSGTAAQFVELLARAVQAAHERGVVHRDLKPGNILLDEQGDNDAGLGVPKVTDFGLAKLLNAESNLTMTNSVMGSPSYMAPEQAEGKVREVGPPADIYALGAILYELLTGRPPFRGASVLETLQQVKTAEPAPPSRFVPRLDRDIETIALKCLEKEASRRYATAAALADDLDRFRRGEPIAARPIGRIERALRWARRRPIVAALAASLALVSVTAFALVTWKWLEADRATRLAETRTIQEGDARRSAIAAQKSATEAYRLAENTITDLYVSNGIASDVRHDPAQAFLWFAEAARRAADDALRRSVNLTRTRLWRHFITVPKASFESRFLYSRHVLVHPGGHHLLTIAADAGPSDEGCCLWDLDTGRQLPVPGGGRGITGAAWSPDGSLLALGESDGDVRVHHHETGTLVASESAPGVVVDLKFSGDGRYLAFAGGDFVRVWDARSRRLTDRAFAHTGRVLALEVDSKGERLTTLCDDKRGRVFRIDGDSDGNPVEFRHVQLWEPGDSTVGRPFPPVLINGGAEVLSSPNAATLDWHDTSSGRLIRTVQLSDDLHSIAISLDGRQAAVGILGGVRFYDLTSGREVGSPLVHKHNVVAIAFIAGGKQVVTACADGMVRFWSLPDGNLLHSPVRHQTAPQFIRMLHDGRHLVTVQYGGLARLWLLPEGNVPGDDIPLDGQPSGIVSDPSGTYIALTGTSFKEGNLKSTFVSNIRTGKSAGPTLHPGGLILDATFSPDGRHLAVLSSRSSEPGLRRTRIHKGDGEAGQLQIWEWRTGRPVSGPTAMPSEPRSVVYSPDGRRLAILCAGGQLLQLEAATGRKISISQDETFFTRLGNGTNAWFYFHNGAIAYSRDGRRLASWGMGETVRLWDGDTLKPAAPPLPFTVRCYTAEFSRDGRELVTAEFDRRVRVWDLSRPDPRCVQELAHPERVFRVRLSSDGRYALTSCMDGSARLWDRKTGRLACPPMPQEDEVFDARFTPMERWIVSVSRNATVRVWDRSTGLPVSPVMPLPGRGYQLEISADGHRVAVGGYGPALRVFHLDDLAQSDQQSLDEAVFTGELSSGQMIHEGGLVSNLTAAEWIERWKSYLRVRNGNPPASHEP